MSKASKGRLLFPLLNLVRRNLNLRHGKVSQSMIRAQQKLTVERTNITESGLIDILNDIEKSATEDINRGDELKPRKILQCVDAIKNTH